MNLSRSSVYYCPRPASPEDLARRPGADALTAARAAVGSDELHLERPFAGSRMLRDFLNREGVAIGRWHVATLIKRIVNWLRIEA